MWWCISQPHLGRAKKTVGFFEGPSYLGHSPHTNHFLLCCPLNNRRSAASVKSVNCFLSSLACILIFFLRSGNIHPNPCPIFPCPVRTGHVTWRSRLVQCCSCFKWVHLRCLLLSFSRFKTLGSSHSWSCSPAATLLFLEVPNLPKLCLLGLLQLVYLHPLFNVVHLPPLLPIYTSGPPTFSNLLPFFHPRHISSLCTLSTLTYFWLFTYTSCFLFVS